MLHCLTKIINAEVTTDSLVKISVIVTAHDRKQYLLEALNSIISQDAGRENFEILCVKNFEDEKIDRYCETHSIKVIVTTDGPLGDKMGKGIEKAEGELISFLDDDDLFDQQKISRILEIQNRFPDLNYYHNSVEKIDENGIPISNSISETEPVFSTVKVSGNSCNQIGEIIRSRGDWYSSTIVVSRNVADKAVPFLLTQSASFDKVLFLTALSLEGTIVLDNLKLTKYRFHESLTTINSDFHTFINKKADFFLKSGQTFNFMMRNQAFAGIKEELLYYKLRDDINYYVISLNPKFVPSLREIIFFIGFSVKCSIGINLIWPCFYFIRKFSWKIASNTYFKYNKRQIGFAD